MPRDNMFLFMAAIAALLACCKNGPEALPGEKDPMLDDCGLIKSSLEEVEVDGVWAADVLVVINNTSGMKERQELLVVAMDEFIRGFLDPEVDPETGRRVRPLFQDLHVGIISTDMGSGGYYVETCSNPMLGDDGILRHTPDPEMPGCDDAYPTFLSYQNPVTSAPDAEAIDKLTGDFGCLAVLGEGGCMFEQPLEAAYKAILQHSMMGGANAGFFRSDLLVIIFISDEDDCSVADPQIFDTEDGSLGHVNLRCFLHPDKLHSLERFLDGFMSLGGPRDLIIGVIAGVPTEAGECSGYGDEISDCLANPLMTEEIDPLDDTRLRPSCNFDGSNAFPPRRLVTLAQGFGPWAVVGSICSDDLSPFMEKLLDLIPGEWVSRQQLPVKKDPSDPSLCRVEECQLLIELPDISDCPVGTTALDRDGDGEPDYRTFQETGDRHSLCIINQISTRAADPELACDDPSQTLAPVSEDAGWYYLLDYNEEGRPASIFPRDFISSLPIHSRIYRECTMCTAPPLGVEGQGGQVGADCEPAYCPPPPPDYPEDWLICDWDEVEIYLAESQECSGGGCLAFQVNYNYQNPEIIDERVHGPYCSRRCGPSADGLACPEGFVCFAAFYENLVEPTCFCVLEDSLNDPYGVLMEGIDACL